MSGGRDDALLLDDIVDAAEELVRLGESAGEGLGGDRAINDRVLWNLTVLGEAAKRVDADVRELNPDIPWTDMAETRDRLVHHYEGVDWEVLAEILRVELPPVLPLLRKVRDQLCEEPGAST